MKKNRQGTLSKNSRRDFLKGLGATATGAAAVVVTPTRVEEKVIVKEVVEHKLVTQEHFLTYGDGTKEGDRATIMVNGQYRSHVLKNGKWRLMFMD